MITDIEVQVANKFITTQLCAIKGPAIFKFFVQIFIHV